MLVNKYVRVHKDSGCVHQRNSTLIQSGFETQTLPMFSTAFFTLQ